MKKIPRDPNWHYLKWLGIAVISIILFGIINNIDNSLSVLSFIMRVLSPIFIGAFIALILNIPVSIFENKLFGRLTRKNGRIWSKTKRLVSITLSITAFFLLTTLLLSYVIPEFVRTAQGFISKADKYMDNLTNFVREWIINLNLPMDPDTIDFTYDTVISWLTSLLGDTSNDMFHTTVNTLITVFSSVWNVILGFILAIYIVASKESLSKMTKGLLYSITSKEKAESVISVSRLSKKAFEGFICGQCIEVLLIGTLTFIGMCIFKFPYAIMISCIIAVTAFIPIFGPITGAIIGAFLILLVDPMQAIWFLVFIIILQQIESNVIYPRIMGQQVGLPGLWVLIAVVLGGEFFGIPGIIISVPLCSVLYTLLHAWILKRLREKRLCKQDATHIPNEITPLSDEEFFAESVEERNDSETDKNSSRVSIKQKKSTRVKSTKGKKGTKK